MATEPWAVMGSWEAPSDPPGLRAAMQRAERLERLEGERRKAEQQERADERRERWAMARMQQLAWEGKAFDPSDWHSLAEPEGEMLARVWSSQDAADTREYRRTLIDAGLLHELAPRFASPSPVVEILPAAGTASRIQSKVRGALRRWASDRRSAARKAARAEEYENR